MTERQKYAIQQAIEDGDKFLTAKVAGTVYIVLEDGALSVGKNPGFQATLDYVPHKLGKNLHKRKGRKATRRSTRYF